MGCFPLPAVRPCRSIRATITRAIMKLSVWGLGYVGTVSAGCLAQEGHEVIGVDSEPTKVDLISEGKSPIIEKDIGAIIERQVAAGRLSATTDAAVGVGWADLDRKSTRLNSSHLGISYAVFCLKKK